MNEAKKRILVEQTLSDEGEMYKKLSKIQSRFWHVFNNPNIAKSEQKLEEWFQNVIPDKRVLEIGCYEGTETRKLLAFRPGHLVGIDISPRAVSEASAKFGKDANFIVCDAHQLTFSNESYDVVYGRAILHHLDFRKAILEIYRVLVPGGYAIFVEPLIHNPFLKVYRKLTPYAHSPYERPLSKNQIQWADEIFGKQYHYFAGISTTFFGVLTSMVGLNPNNFVMQFADKLDCLAVGTPLKWWARVVYLVWQKI